MIIVVEGPPVPKARPRAGQGHFFTPAVTQIQEMRIRSAMNNAGVVMAEAGVKLVVRAYFPVAKSWNKSKRAGALSGSLRHTGIPDADNILKLVGDAGNGTAWKDDGQVVEATVSKWYSDCPRTEIEIVEA